ncbi:MAG: 6-bladed beta-propeller [Oscillibacter sp.]|nr:6-bladed beta-propeller [Oscillibacter sp.]
MKIGYIIAGLLLCACQRTLPDKQNLVIDLTRYANTSEFRLSEICDSISYIPLETCPESILKGHNLKVLFTSEHIFINDSHIGLYKFSKAGKYLGKLAKQGRGPQEFIQIMDFDISPKTNELFIYDNMQGKIEVFDTSLHPVNTLKPVPYNIRDIAIDNNHRIVCSVIRNDYRAQGQPQNSLMLLSATDGKPIFTRESLMPSGKPQKRANFMFAAKLTKYQDHVYYKEHRSDTYYCLRDSAAQDSVIYQLNIGSTYPAELDYDWDKYELTESFPRLEKAIETLRYIFIYFSPKNEYRRLACYDKKEKELSVFPAEKFPENDLDQGWSPMCGRKINDTTLLEVIPALEFQELYKDKPPFPVSEEDNPILMLIHLKK